MKNLLFELYLLKNKVNKGFTLIELLVVVIIVGVLAAVSLPALLGQIGKAREVELKTSIGTVNRSQQAYHWERREFAKGVNADNTISMLGLNLSSQYITNVQINVDNGNAQEYATIILENSNFNIDKTRAYSGGVFTEAGVYTLFLCQSQLLAQQIPAPNITDGCGVNDKIN